MTLEQAQKLLREHNQEQLLTFYEQCTPEQQQLLLEDISKIDFTVVEKINGQKHQAVGALTPIECYTVKQIQEREQEFFTLGAKALKEGKVGAVLLAGGQGSRLGHEGPKGTYNIGITKPLYIFEQQMNNIKEVVNKVGATFPIYVMTSDINDKQTRTFFAEHNYFGYPQEKIHFFMQEMAVTCDFNGKIYLEDAHKVSKSPNGNGGWYVSLKRALSDQMQKDGVEWLNLYAVDNVLQRICDPVFIGATLSAGVNCGAKVVKKARAEERVGVLCLENGKPSVIEYYEMPEKENYATDEQGELIFAYGVILNYLFKLSQLEEIIDEGMPLHFAEKKINYYDGAYHTPEQPNGYKFETLAVDMVKNMKTCLGYEVEREKEFAPVKNKTGVDSVESARALLQKNGIQL